MRRLGFIVLLPVVLVGLVGCDGRADRLRINDIQVLASHNSYHQEPEPALLDVLRSFLGAEADGFQYTHLSLADELDHGVRQVELDLFVDDPTGGRYADPKLAPLLGLEPIDPRMSEPGLKVFHVQEVDYRSSCPTFVSCLEQLRAWSDAHPDHLPITIQIEPKDDAIPDPANLGFVTPVAWDTAAFGQLEQEISSVFPTERIITPGEVMGNYRTLKGAVLHDRWPTVERARGRVMFTLDDTGEERAAYRQLHDDMADRLVFVAAAPPAPDAAIVVVNDPVDDADRIRHLVGQGFIVRTRADADTVQARTGDTTQRDSAWASGAHFVSTDYVVPDDRFGTGYVVELPGGGVARCNPVRRSEPCTLN
jgi:hypothetical protein